MTRLRLYALLGVAAIPTVSAAKTTTKVPTERPNILFILSDDHAMPAISAYGGRFAEIAPTPNLDQIADNGVLFNHMICTNSISGPSRACLITGKYGTTNGLFQNEGSIIFDNTQQTTPKIFKANGYTTSLFGKWHMNSEPKGFDHYMIHADPSHQGRYWDPIYEINGEMEVRKGYSTNLTTDAALEWMEKDRDADKPFCMMLHYKSPHRPCNPDSIYLHLFDDVELPYPETFNDDYATREETLGVNMATVENHFSREDLKMVAPRGFDEKHTNQWIKYGGSGDDQYWTPDPQMSKEEVKKWKYQQYYKDYLRCIRSVDDNVGRVIDYLKENGLYENTIIVYMGDQGFFLGEHGIYDKRWMYEEAIHMPCLFSYPKLQQSGERIDKLAVNVDIAPTLLDFAGIKIPKDMHGESLRKVIEDEESVKKWRESIYYHYFEYPKWHRVQPHFGVRTDRYKLIHFYYNIDKWEFYDLEKDPNELTNQYNNAEYSSIISNLKKEIVRLQKLYDDDMSLEDRRELTERYMITY